MRHKDNRGLSFLGDSLAGDSPGRLPPLKEFRIRRVEATNDSAQGGDFEPFPARILRLTTSYAGKLRPIRPEDCRGPTFRIRVCRKKLLVENIPFRTSPQGAKSRLEWRLLFWRQLPGERRLHDGDWVGGNPCRMSYPVVNSSFHFQRKTSNFHGRSSFSITASS